MGSSKQIFLMLPPHDPLPLIAGLETLGYKPDPWNKTSLVGMRQAWGQDGTVDIYTSSETFVWKADFPAVCEQITAHVGTDQWMHYVIYFTYHPQAEAALLKLIDWMHTQYPQLTVVTSLHHVFSPDHLPLKDRAMLYWGNDPWDDED
ncbi:hypothetical protein Haur_2082 [Herpetosiphon aurantiacus DSM 785]|uniref:Uncharacterized protein n=1 Tax=Herpetosiphon aurantiacus (strain ATCC 23779 / DSM 785 / 114-95) TaxID=316274 RepID=A9AW72_HERA2|nr:hypothetical protein Haur_2082 [Herpetosiphon aurantiacus DSM 785]